MTEPTRKPSASFRIAAQQLGDLAVRMWHEQGFAWRQLKHSDWNVRYFALVALEESWGLTKGETFAVVKSMLDGECHEKLAMNLIGNLAGVFVGIANGEVSRFVAGIVSGAEWPVRVRLQAYLALEKINMPRVTFVGVGELDPERIGKNLAEIRSEMNVIDSESLSSIDWGFVNQFLP